MLQRLINSQLPGFAHPDHPVMRYVLQREGRRVPVRVRWLRRIGFVALLAVLLLFGWQVANNFGAANLDDTLNPLGRVYLVLYWPLVLLQIGMRLIAFDSTTNIVNGESTRGTWDTLKITTDGAGLTMRTRWAAVFYQLRYVLLIVVAARLFFVAVALIDFTSFQGRYLDLMISGTIPLGSASLNPVLALVLAILAVSLQMTAAILAPFTAIAFDAALGSLLGSLLRGRWLGILGHVAILLVRVAITGLCLWFGALALSFAVVGVNGGALTTANFDSFVAGGLLHGWLGAFAGIVEGDLGLTLLHLPHVQRLFADLDYGALIGVAALVYVLAQAGLAQFMLRWAIRHAARAEKN